MPSGIYLRKRKSLKERFEEKISPEPNSGCWLWIAHTDVHGYGAIRAPGKEGKMLKAHRVAYELYVGSIPKELEIDHLCCVSGCVNPQHLELVTRQENCRRAANAGTYGKKNRSKTHCPQGHEYTPENTYVAPNGWRQYQICRREYMKAHWLKQKE